MALRTFEWYKKSFIRKINHQKDLALVDRIEPQFISYDAYIQKLETEIAELRKKLEQTIAQQDNLRLQHAARKNDVEINIVPELDRRLQEIDPMRYHVVAPTSKRLTCDAWCRKNAAGRWLAHKTTNDLVYFFENKNDAMLFKLTFG